MKLTKREFLRNFGAGAAALTAGRALGDAAGYSPLPPGEYIADPKYGTCRYIKDIAKFPLDVPSAFIKDGEIIQPARKLTCFRQTDAVYKPAAGAFWRKCTAKEVTLAAVAAEFAERNRDLPEEQQFKGVVLVMTPHLFTPSVPFRPTDCPYAWSSKRFGAGLDNEALMNYSIREVENAAAAVAPLPVMVQIPDFYYNWVKSGKLPAGTLIKFSASAGGKARELVLLNSGNKPSELFSKVEAGLKSTPAAVPVLVAVNLAPHTAVTKGELRRRNWDDLVRSIRYAAGRYRGSRNVSGVILGPYSRLEILLEEK